VAAVLLIFVPNQKASHKTTYARLASNAQTFMLYWTVPRVEFVLSELAVAYYYKKIILEGMLG
jgi:16S rRNA C1402 (ribose-2'-O) methylase RsmI